MALCYLKYIRNDGGRLDRARRMIAHTWQRLDVNDKKTCYFLSWCSALFHFTFPPNQEVIYFSLGVTT